MCPNIGTPKIINFALGTKFNAKFIAFSTLQYADLCLFIR